MGVAPVKSQGIVSLLPMWKKQFRSVYKQIFHILPYRVLQNGIYK